MRIPVNHPDAGDPLLAAIGRTLEGFGARVVLDPEGENLVRALGARRELPIPPCGPLQGRSLNLPVAEICAQGLPNLLHEYLHVVQSRCLDDDHGIDYGAIPFDLAQASGRAVLWEELACCVLSCAYLVGSRGKLDASIDAWFVEQVEIQPVFYGMDDDADGFWRRVGSLLLEHGEEQRTVEVQAYDVAEQTLLWAGADPSVARPVCRLTLPQMLRRCGRWSDA